MKSLLFPLILVVFAFAASWPLLLRRWPYWRLLLGLSTFLILAFGGIVMLHFQMEKNFARSGEAMALSATCNYLREGGDPTRLAAELDALRSREDFNRLPLRSLMRGWFSAVRKAEGAATEK